MDEFFGAMFVGLVIILAVIGLAGSAKHKEDPNLIKIGHFSYNIVTFNECEYLQSRHGGSLCHKSDCKNPTHDR